MTEGVHDADNIKKTVEEIREIIKARMRACPPKSWEHWYISRTLLDFRQKSEEDRHQLMVLLARSISVAERNILWSEYNYPQDLPACERQRAFYYDIFALLAAPQPLEAIDPLDGQTRPLFRIVLRLTFHFAWYEQGNIAVWLRSQGY